MSHSSKSNVFIVFEGIDFAGKTTIAKNLSNITGGQYIESPPEPFVAIKQRVLENSAPLARFCFFLSSNIQAATIAKDMLNKTHVICDRYIWSTIAYHAALENADPDFLMSLVNPFMNSLVMPDFIIFLTVNREIQLSRSKNRISDDDLQRCLLISESFQQQLRRAYYDIKRFFRIPWIEIDTSNISIPETTQRIIKKIGMNTLVP